MSKGILVVEHQKDDRQIGLRTPGKLIFPEVFESVRSQGRVADRGHDRSVAEIGLDGASVVAVVGELEPSGMPQHVGMHEEREFRRHARPDNHALMDIFDFSSATRFRETPPSAIVYLGNVG